MSDGEWDYKKEVGALVDEARDMDENFWNGENRNSIIERIVWTVESAWNLRQGPKPK